MNLHDIASGVLGLGLIAGAVLLVALGGRDRAADEHDVGDYKRALAPARRDWPLVDRQLCSSPDCPACADDDLPPAPPGMNAGSPLYAETLFRSWRQGETPEATAARFLREIGDQAKAKTADRDMTGAFPVVRAA